MSLPCASCRRWRRSRFERVFEKLSNQWSSSGYTWIHLPKRFERPAVRQEDDWKGGSIGLLTGHYDLADLQFSNLLLFPCYASCSSTTLLVHLNETQLRGPSQGERTLCALNSAVLMTATPWLVCKHEDLMTCTLCSRLCCWIEPSANRWPNIPGLHP